MEKTSNNNPTKLSKMLQKALSVGHSAPPFSPVRDFHHHRNRGFFFSGPITPLLPTAAARARRRTSKNAVVLTEPTSPKVSCIGQIKLTNCPETKNRKRKNLKTASLEAGKENWLKLKRLFSMGSRKSNCTAVLAASEHPITAAEAVVAAPSLCKMKKFASSRETLVGYDWTVEIKREESRSDHRRGYSSDDKETMIPCSVSMRLDQREGVTMFPRQKSEVNLWKRRTMDRPKPLQVKATY